MEKEERPNVSEVEWVTVERLLGFAVERGVTPDKVAMDRGGTPVLAKSGDPFPTTDIPLESTQQPVLILLDMNGTLLYRAKGTLEGPSAPPHSFQHADLFYYFRPGAKDLVQAILAHPRARLAFYTSMRGSNALPAAQYLLPEGSMESEVYDRPFNVRDPMGKNEWDTMRDLDRVWSESGRVGSGFGPEDTLMVDDSPQKLRHMPDNALIVPEYNEARIYLETHSRDGERDGGDGAASMADLQCLYHVKDYLSRLLDECEGDVRVYTVERPLALDIPPREP